MKFFGVKKFLIIFFVVFFLFILTFINILVIRNKNQNLDNRVINDLPIKLKNNDFSDINYDYLNNNLCSLDELLENQILKLDNDIKKRTEYYKRASYVYDSKLEEYKRIFYNILSNKECEIFDLDIDNFYKALEYGANEIINKYQSTIDSEYYVQKYLYDEKKLKCHEILDKYEETYLK